MQCKNHSAIKYHVIDIGHLQKKMDLILLLLN